MLLQKSSCVIPKKFFALLTFFLVQFFSSQENLTFGNDQFSGISSAPVSPAQPFLNPNPWDINFISEDVFLQNDYTYVSDMNFLAFRNTEVKSVSNRKNIHGYNTSHIQDYYNSDFAKYHFSSDILGPSFSLKTNIKNQDFQVGVFTRLRTQTSAISVDNYLKFGNQSILEPEEYTLKPLDLNLMNWGEIGFNIGTNLFPNAEQQWIFGANFKYEMGFDALQIKSLDPIILRRYSETTNGVKKKTIDATNYNIEANLATNYNFDSNKYEFKQKGKGFGLDLEIAFVDRDLDAEDYNVKASFAVLDIGKINFAGEQHLFKGNTLKIVNNPNLENTKFDSPQKYFQLLSDEIYGDKNASFRGNSFSMGLPTSLHFNLSKNLKEHQYVGLDWIQRAPVFENSLKRSNIVNLSYTVQKPVIGYGASVSLYEYESLQFGGYVRIGPLILGSSNVFPLLFNQKKLHSGDFYIALKLYPFWDTEMKRHRRAKCNCD